MKLKSVLLGLLFSFLFIPSFSSASEMLDQGIIQVNVPEDVNISGRGYSFYLDGNIYTDGYGQYLYWKNNGTSKTLQYIYGRDNGRLYFFGTTTDLNNRITQGYINSFCKSSSVSGCYPVGTSYTIVSADDFYGLNPNITKIAVGNTSVALDWSNNDWGFYLCYFNDNDSNYYCAISAPVPYGGDVKWSSLTGSLGFTSIDNAKNYNRGFSPFSFDIPPAYLDDDYTNQDVMLAWSRLGYNLTLCYSNFPITDLFDMSGSVYQIYNDYLEDGMGAGTGATVIDLYNQVNLLSFESFMSQVVQNTRVMLNNDFIPNYFNGRPVGLGVIGSKVIDHLVYYSDVFNYTDYYQYCNFALGLSNSDPEWDNEYTGPALPDYVEDNLDKEKNIRICSHTGMESSAFCGGFSAGGGGGGGGSRIASISDFYNEGFGILDAVKGITGPEFGILPPYIIVGFLGFVLLYILKR